MIFDNKKSEEERRAEYMRRYEASKKRELDSGSEGELYKQSLRNLQKRRKKKRLIRNIKQALVYVAVFAILILIIVGLYLAIKQLFTDNDTASVQETVTPTVVAAPEPSGTPTLTPIPTSAITLPAATPLATIAPTADYRGLVVIDPGHGGIDGGTCVNDVNEKDLNLEMSFKLKSCLEQYGYTVMMTREEDVFVELIDRANFANNLDNCIAFVSVHCNAFEGDSSVNGVEVWCYDRSGSVEMSESILEQVVESTGAKNRGIGFRTNHTVTRRTTMPACIVECGYLSGDVEHELLQDAEYQQRIIDGIVVGLDLFLQEWN